MAKLITFTEIEDFDGRLADVTYHVPSSLDASAMSQAEIDIEAYSVTWQYKDGSKKVVDNT